MMGVVFGNRPVESADGWELTSATHGAAQAFDEAVGYLGHDAGRAGAALELAIKLAPRFGLAYIAWAHALMENDDLAPLAAGLLMMAGKLEGTERERSHLEIAQTRFAKERAEVLERVNLHLGAWPCDRLCLAVGSAA
jgi:hypothetical protein